MPTDVAKATLVPNPVASECESQAEKSVAASRRFSWPASCYERISPVPPSAPRSAARRTAAARSPFTSWQNDELVGSLSGVTARYSSHGAFRCTHCPNVVGPPRQDPRERASRATWFDSKPLFQSHEKVVGHQRSARIRSVRWPTSDRVITAGAAARRCVFSLGQNPSRGSESE